VKGAGLVPGKRAAAHGGGRAGVRGLPRLLVLCSSLPGQHHGGGVVMEEVLRRYPPDRFACFCTALPGAAGERPEWLRNVPCRHGPLLPRVRLRGARFYMPAVRAVAFRWVAPLRVRQAVAFGRAHRVDLVWAELQGESVILARDVAEGLGVPLVGTVWDDPAGWFQDRGYDRAARRFVLGRFGEALRAARNLSTAGEAMQAAYRREYGVDSVILRHGFERAATAPRPSRRDGVVVGFVGSVYGRDAWGAFLAALARLNASGRYPAIRIRMFGSGGLPCATDGVRIEHRGWAPAEDMLREIAETDFCYLPYWFEPRRRRHVELSFPNKLETYMAAGKAVLYHGPEYAGVVRTIRDYGLGMCVHSLSPGAVAEAVGRLISDDALRGAMEAAALRAFREEFNLGVLLRNFASLIGVEPRALVSDGGGGGAEVAGVSSRVQDGARPEDPVQAGGAPSEP